MKSQKKSNKLILILILNLLLIASCSKTNINKEVTKNETENNFNGNETNSEKELEKLENSLKENENYIHTSAPKKNNEESISSSSSGPIKLNNFEELKERLLISKSDFYLPEYIPDGFEISETKISYYLCHDNFDVNKPPIKIETLSDGSTFEIYQSEDNYKEFVDGFYITYWNRETKNALFYDYNFEATMSNNTANKDEIPNSISVTKEDLLQNGEFLARENEISYEAKLEIEPIGILGTPQYYEDKNTIEKKYIDFIEDVSLRITSNNIEEEEIAKIKDSIYKLEK